MVRRLSKRILFWTATGLIVAVVLAAIPYLREIDRAYERIREKGNVVASPYGDIEYTETGSGPVVLVIHGSGGGYDQGELIAQAVLGRQFHTITPSRFGYLRSTFHAAATWDDQAHAYAYLLNHLGAKKVAVVAMSHGCPSALHFAILHPEQLSSLTLISCGVVPSSTSDLRAAAKKGELLTAIFKYDLPYWAITRLFKKQPTELIGANKAVIADLTSAQRQFIGRFIDYMNPASMRSAGIAFDMKTALPGKKIAAITAPTLIFHAIDDTLQLYHNAEFASSIIPDAKLARFEKGGHVLIVTEQSAVRTALQRHILDNMSDIPPRGL